MRTVGTALLNWLEPGAGRLLRVADAGDCEVRLLYRTAGRTSRKSVRSWRMGWIMWRPLSLRDGAAWLVTFSATFAGGIYILERFTGWHPLLLDIALSVAGALSASGARRVFRATTHKSRDTPTDHRGEPDYHAVPGLAPEVVILVDQGRKIQAVKRYRELNPGIGLKEAKDVIDEVASRNRGQLLP